MAQVVTVGGQQFKIRNIFAVWIGLPIITLGVYAYVWYYKINNEARRYLNDDSIKPVLSLLAILVGWVLIVPPFISVYRTAGRVRRMQQQAGLTNQITPWIALALLFVLNLDRLYIQSELNRLWERYSVPAAGYPLPPPHPPAT
jgi:L-lactate permease